jgi:hypothetical protein
MPLTLESLATKIVVTAMPDTTATRAAQLMRPTAASRWASSPTATWCWR